MTTLKKTITIVLSIIMTLALAIPAFADEQAATSENNSSEVIRILKEITVYNPETVIVNEPTATYTYNIAAGQSGASLEDENGIKTVTKKGVLENVLLNSETSENKAANTSLTYSADGNHHLNASVNGTANTKWIEIDFSNVNFGAAGVYRYVIQETAKAYNSNGIVEGNTGHVRYLDVYVKDAENQSEALNESGDWDVYGYVLFAEEEGAVSKTTGFETRKDEINSENNKYADQYYTFNLSVSKEVVNDSFIKTTHHQFPFTLTLSNETVIENVLPIMTVFDNAFQEALTAGSISGEWEAKIADGASIQYVGIPAGTTIGIQEMNDVTGAVYSVTSKGAETELTGENIYTNDTSKSAVVTKGSAGTKATANSQVTFTNTLQQISPTGVVLRVAPYVLMLAAGIFILMIARRHRMTNEE